MASKVQHGQGSGRATQAQQGGEFWAEERADKMGEPHDVL
jgi:hypothetical protein